MVERSIALPLQFRMRILGFPFCSPLAAKCCDHLRLRFSGFSARPSRECFRLLAGEGIGQSPTTWREADLQEFINAYALSHRTYTSLTYRASLCLLPVLEIAE